MCSGARVGSRCADGRNLGWVKVPESTRGSLATRLGCHARERWPDLARVRVRFRANFAYLDGELVDGTVIELCRLRCGGSASSWGFAIYPASRDGYEDSVLPSGAFAGTPEEALDCACGLHLSTPEVWRSTVWRLDFPS